MAENSENIEAKLCAYVEGDLDEAEQAEIEKHLQAHPNHRRLLTELAATRDLLRTLPREPAPPELAETFNGQLERSVLLDYTGTDSVTPSIRANLLPRLLATAAVFVLAALLVIVTYLALPGGGGSAVVVTPPDPNPNGPADGTVLADILATTQPETGPTIDPAGGSPSRRVIGGSRDAASLDGAVEDVEDDSAEGDTARTSPLVRAPEMLKAAGPASPADTEPSAGMGGGGRGSGDETKAMDADPADLAPRGRLAKKEGGPSSFSRRGNNFSIDTDIGAEAVYVIINAADPSAALEEVQQTLLSNRIEWDAAEPDVAQPGQNRSALTAPSGERFVEAQFNNALQLKRSNALQFEEKTRQQQLASRGGQRRAGAAGTERNLKAGGPSRSRAVPSPGGASAQRQAAANPANAADAPPAPAGLAGGGQAGTAGNSEVAQGASPEGVAPDAATSEADTEPAVSGVAKTGTGGFDDEASPAPRSPAPADTDSYSAARDSEAAQGNAPPEPSRGLTEQEVLREELAQEQRVVDEDAALPGVGQGAQDLDLRDIQCIIAYDMTPQQTIELGELLARGGRQQVELISEEPRLQSANVALQRRAVAPTTADGVAARPRRALRSPALPAPAAAAPAPATAPGDAGDGVDADAEAKSAPPPPDAPKPIRPPLARKGSLASASPTPATSPAPSATSTGPSAMPAGMAGMKPRAATPGAADVAPRQGAPRQPPPIRPGERLSVTVDELAGPDSDKTVIAEVASDGTIQLPRLKPLRVAGMARQEAERYIADAYRNAEVIDSPTVSVDRLPRAVRQSSGRAQNSEFARAPKSAPRQPAEPPAAPAEAPPAPGPADPLPDAAPAQPTRETPEGESIGTLADGALAPRGEAASEPGVRAEAPAEKRINVVILVKRNPGSAGSAEPGDAEDRGELVDTEPSAPTPAGRSAQDAASEPADDAAAGSQDPEELEPTPASPSQRQPEPAEAR